MNLTAITDPAKIRERHFIDSLEPLPWIVSRETGSKPVSLLDIGAGAGFPGIPLKIAHPSLRLTLVDSIKKKCDFMKEVIRSLDLPLVEVIYERLDMERKSSLGQTFDVVISRAALKLPDFIRLSLPYLIPSGLGIAMKGEHSDQELKESQTLLESLRLPPASVVDYVLPMTGLKRRLIMFHVKQSVG